MRVVIQRVTHAWVTIHSEKIAEIKNGLLVLCGFEEDDSQSDFDWMVKKILQLRIFNDENQIMNLSISDSNGEILLVSQFTLYASTKKGNRPSYIRASKPELAKTQYDTFCETFQREWKKDLQKGVFGADMKVCLENDGPVTILMDSRNKE